MVLSLYTTGNVSPGQSLLQLPLVTAEVRKERGHVQRLSFQVCYLTQNDCLSGFCFPRIPLCKCISHFHYPYISWWTFGLFPLPGYYKKKNIKYGWASISVEESFGYISKKDIAGQGIYLRIARQCGRSISSFLRKCHTNLTSLYCYKRLYLHLLSFLEKTIIVDILMGVRWNFTV